MKSKAHMKALHSCGRGGFFCPCCRPKKTVVARYVRAIKRSEKHDWKKEVNESEAS